jgi:hypothetical protein
MGHVMNRKQLTITVSMLNAGAAAMELCRKTGGHTPHTACHAIFQSMLAVSDWSPAIRTRPAAKTRTQALEHPLEWYRDQTIGPFAWYGYHAKTNYHYLRQTDPEKWIRLKDEQWHYAHRDKGLDLGWYWTSTSVARAAMGVKHESRYPKQKRSRKGEFQVVTKT